MKVFSRLGVEDVAVPADLVVDPRIADQPLGQRQVLAFGVGDGVVGRLHIAVAIDIHVGVVVRVADGVVRKRLNEPVPPFRDFPTFRFVQ